MCRLLWAHGHWLGGGGLVSLSLRDASVVVPTCIYV